MFEPIVAPENTSYIIMTIVGFVLMVSSFIVSIKTDDWIPIVLGFAVFIILFGFGFAEYQNDIREWKEQVKEQVETLECEQLQEAHEEYGFNYIKEKFVFECVETREAWYLDN